MENQNQSSALSYAESVGAPESLEEAVRLYKAGVFHPNPSVFMEANMWALQGNMNALVSANDSSSASMNPPNVALS